MQQTICPVCKKTTLLFSMLTREIPYFGKVLILSSKCSSCGFKHNDVFNLEIKEPTEFRVEVKNEEDLMIRVIRSSSGTVIVPELGIKIEPGPQCQGAITNVEGVLRRIEKVLKYQARVQKGKKLERVKKLLEKIKRMIEGKEKFTLIIKDPLGNSGIISKKAKKRKLKKSEISKLKTGYILFNVNP